VSTLKEYDGKYSQVQFERSNGVLLVRLHTDGGPLVWNGRAHEDLGRMFADIGNDHHNHVVILTGTGDSFIAEVDLGEQASLSGGVYARLFREGRHLTANLLDIDVPVIAAVNGPATVHAELAVLCDIVLAVDSAVFSDSPHFPMGIVPGDGVHVVWPMLLGPNRGRYFLLTGQQLNAREALELGVVNEVVSAERLLPRAFELAALVLRQPARIRSYARQLLVHDIKRKMAESLTVGIAMEGLGAAEYWPVGQHRFPTGDQTEREVV